MVEFLQTSSFRVIAICLVSFSLVSVSSGAAKNEERWKAMPEAQKKELKNRFEKFNGLTPEKKAKILERHQKFQALPLERQKLLRERHNRLKVLPPEIRKQKIQELRDRKKTQNTLDSSAEVNQ